MGNLSNSIDAIFASHEKFFPLTLLEVPQKGGTIQIHLPNMRILTHVYHKKHVLETPRLGSKRCCAEQAGCNAQNRAMLMFLGKEEAQLLENQFAETREFFQTLLIVELHHSAQLFYGDAFFPTRGRKHIEACSINHSPKTDNGRFCFPRVAEFSELKPEPVIGILKH